MPEIKVSKQQIVIALVIAAILIGIFLYVRRKDLGTGEKGSSKCTIPEPDIPDKVVAESRKKFEITVAWSKSKQAESYKVYRYTEDPLKGMEAVQIAETKDNAIGFQNLKNSKQWIRVRAVKGCATSDFSETVFVELDSELVLSYNSLKPKYCNGANCSSGKSLEWDRQVGASGYGIFIPGQKFSRQLFVEDEGSDNRMEVLLPNMNEPNSTIMTAVNSNGQSNLIVAHSKY